MPRRKQYEIVSQVQTDEPLHLDFDNRHVEVSLGGRKGITTIDDAGLAREIDARFGDQNRSKEGGKVIVIEVDDRDKQREPGHVYSFQVPDMSRFEKKRKRA